jgi:hypothetical protein
LGGGGGRHCFGGGGGKRRGSPEKEEKVMSKIEGFFFLHCFFFPSPERFLTQCYCFFVSFT